MRRTVVALALAGLCFSTSAAAAPIYFTANAVLPGDAATLAAARTAFQAAAATAGVTLTMEGFEGAFAATNLPISFPLGGPYDFTVSETTGAQQFSQISGNTLITTEGNSVLSFNTDDPSVIQIAFAQPINAFGVDITSIDFSGTHISFADDLGNVLAGIEGVPVFASAAFFGVVNDLPFSTVTFTFAGSEILNFDQLEYGAAAVPEPASLLLLGLGLAGVARARRGWRA